jgi:carbon-monoxide dehydrogenase medium subunit
MKPAPFDYVRPASLAEAFDLLERHGAEARVLAGGQSLLPALALRLSEPALLIDIGSLDALRFIEQHDAAIHIGALTRHCELEASPLVAARLPLVAQAMPHLAHVAIRNRGTIGGSLALADPAAELPACMVALDATIVLASRAGERRVPAAAFFQGLYQTDLRPGELLVRIEIAPPASDWRFHFDELSRRHGDYAIAGLAAAVRMAGNSIDDVRLVFFGCGDRPMRAPGAEALAARQLAGEPRAALQAALRAALATDLDPQSDANAAAATRLHLAAVLAERALRALNH